MKYRRVGDTYLALDLFLKVGTPSDTPLDKHFNSRFDTGVDSTRSVCWPTVLAPLPSGFPSPCVGTRVLIKSGGDILSSNNSMSINSIGVSIQNNVLLGRILTDWRKMMCPLLLLNLLQQYLVRQLFKEQDLDLDSTHITWIQNRRSLVDFNVQDWWGLLRIDPPVVASASKDRLPVAAVCLTLGLAWTKKASEFPSESLSPYCSIGMAEVALPPSALPDAVPLPPIPLVSKSGGIAGKSLKLHPKCCIYNHQN
jgi:hypothetical protein